MMGTWLAESLVIDVCPFEVGHMPHVMIALWMVRGRKDTINAKLFEYIIH